MLLDVVGKFVARILQEIVQKLAEFPSLNVDSRGLVVVATL